MKKTATKTLIFLTAIIVFTGVTTFSQNSNLTATKWKVVEAYGIRITQTAAFIDINANRTRFTGNTGCNSMSGRVYVRGRSINFSNIVTTRRACKLMAGSVPEETFLRGMRNTVSYRHTGNTLRLYDWRGRIVLRFVDSGSDDDDNNGDVRLEDKKWFLESIKNRRTFVPITGAFIVFDDRKRSAGGDTSCNVFGGSYTATRTSISITEIISTMRACVEDGKMNVEREMLDGLRRANRYEISDRLRLYRGSELLLTFRGEQK